MDYKLLRLHTDDRGVASVTLNRPEVHNAFDDKLIAELDRVFTELERDTNVRLVVLSGEGKSFCAGGDLNWMRSMKGYSREENIADAKTLSVMYSRIHGMSKPLIGVVHGAALGGGSGLAAVCDYVIAEEGAKFGFTETRLGILPAIISPYALEKIGPSAARAYFISGMPFNAHTAFEIGLIHKVVPVEHLEMTREEIVNEFLKAGPEAMRKAKLLVRTLVWHPYERDLINQITVQAIADVRVSEEGQEGMDALLSKRKAKWVV